MTRQEIFATLKPLLDKLFGENGYVFLPVTDNRSELLRPKAVSGVKYSFLAGIFLEDTNDRPSGFYIKTSKRVENLKLWANFFCLLAYKNVKIQLDILGRKQDTFLLKVIGPFGEDVNFWWRGSGIRPNQGYILDTSNGDQIIIAVKVSSP